jgi:hypothetical protein
VETLIVTGGQHSWLYEDPEYRRAVARMLTLACGGPLDPETAGEIAAATPAERIPDAETEFAAVAEAKGGLRTLAQVALPGATRSRPGIVSGADDADHHARDARDARDTGSVPARLAVEP